ncbi:uncharacterized protein LOC111355683 [Spodoptera litura]|uniref:Uncharacterized protein LOC111355683 n=1 Tax=Spodoptera litura TaxID=69820 RepID=A0A9J7ITR5_SPOLT|nr:uncharacterized protein LOC111355683 [Spodoptera litura]
MGSSSAPVVANIYMEWFEGQALMSAPVRPRYWWRYYVDDVFAVINREHVAEFVRHLNSVHSSIQFTTEKEKDGMLPFLDVLVLENNGYNWRQCTRSKRRPAVAERTPAFLPYVKGVTDTIGHLLRRRYSIRTIFRTPGQLRHLLRSPKDKDPLAVPGVYMIPCDLAEHACSTGTAHFLRFDKVSVLAREKYFVPRKVREAIEISRRPNFNRDGGWALPPAWKPSLKSASDYSVAGLECDTIVDYFWVNLHSRAVPDLL